MPLHADELPVDLPLARALVDAACPAWADLELTPSESSGSSNALFRLGDDLVVRLPRQPGGGATIAKEAAWLPRVRDAVDVAVPEVAHLGEPGFGYPEQWAVTRWRPGARAAVPVPGATTTEGLAEDLATFIRQLRAMEMPPGATEDPELSWYRGRPLHELDADMREAAASCRSLDLGLDVDDVLAVWDDATKASRDVERVTAWYHGDLLAENLLVDDSGRLCAVLDFGGLALGDPTVDLVVVWEALGDDGRRVLRRELDVDDATWAVSRGWAVFIALMTFPYYGTSMPARCADRMAMAKAAVAGW
ncbi:MAG TPA: phosphotransferase [Angustibacter sp.]|nr:phosphotransferase [Angustibacter sp.]